MLPLSLDAMASILRPYCLADGPLLEQLSVYLDVLLKWNGRMNLTSVREPEEMVRRHFGESLFTARHLPEGVTLLDVGSGAGFPGLPIQLARPELRVTLAESQNKKAAFLREAVRVLGASTEVWGGRAEDMPPDRRFDLVTLRAVDSPGAAMRAARMRVARGGTIAQLITGVEGLGSIRVPNSVDRILFLTLVD